MGSIRIAACVFGVGLLLVSAGAAQTPPAKKAPPAAAKAAAPPHTRFLDVGSGDQGLNYQPVLDAGGAQVDTAGAYTAAPQPARAAATCAPGLVRDAAGQCSAKAARPK